MKPAIQRPLWPYRHFETALRYCLAVIAAHMVVVNGTGYSIFDLLLIPGYYIEMGFSLAVALIIIGWVNFIGNRLDISHPWETYFPMRSILQVVLGVLVPVLIEFFMVALYFWARARINVLRTSFMTREFRLVIFMICFFNLYCIARYFIIKWWLTQNELNKFRESLHVVDENKTELPSSTGGAEANDTPDGVGMSPVFIAHTAISSYPIPVDQIAYFYRSNGHVFLRPFDGQDAILSQSLDQIEAQLDTQQFFRVARHMIINFKSVVDYRPLNFGKIGINLDPPYREQVSTSKLLAHDFRLWLRTGGAHMHI